MTRAGITAISNLPAVRSGGGRSPGDMAGANLNDGTNTLLNIFNQPFSLGVVLMNTASGGNARAPASSGAGGTGASGAAAAPGGGSATGSSAEPIVDFMQNFWAWRRAN